MSKYSCGGFASWDGPCGATDCNSCFPGGCGDEEVETIRDLSGSGYEFDADTGEWSRRVSSGVHVCRRPHRDGRVKVGQTYRKTVVRHVCDETGKQRHERRIMVLR